MRPTSQEPASVQPHHCGEPNAMSNYIRNYEIQNRLPEDSLRPGTEDWNECIGSITSIRSVQGGRDMPPCENCSQMLANLGLRSDQVLPGANGSNFTEAAGAWSSAQPAGSVHTSYPGLP